MVIQASLIILVLYNCVNLICLILYRARSLSSATATQGWNKFGIFVTINPLQVKAAYYGKLDNHMPFKMVEDMIKGNEAILIFLIWYYFYSYDS